MWRLVCHVPLEGVVLGYLHAYCRRGVVASGGYVTTLLLIRGLSQRP